MSLADRIIERVKRRPPDFIIGGEDRPYLLRWYVVRSRVFSIYVHRFLRSDDDRALHDHPWLFNLSLLLRGHCLEHTIAAGGVHHIAQRAAGDLVFRFGAAPHRIELYDKVVERVIAQTGSCERALIAARTLSGTPAPAEFVDRVPPTSRGALPKATAETIRAPEVHP